MSISQIWTNTLGRIDASTLNIILTLLFFFQWYKQHAKEQSVKNNLFAVKRILELRSRDVGASVELLDATLATLCSRNPYRDLRLKVESVIHNRSKKQARAPIRGVGNHKDKTEAENS